MTLSTNPIDHCIPNRKMKKCPTKRHVSVDSIVRSPTHRRRRVTVGGLNVGGGAEILGNIKINSCVYYDLLYILV
jgi:hypothetical protein